MTTSASGSQIMLTSEEMELPRSAADMLLWVDATHKRILVRQVVGRKAGKTYRQGTVLVVAVDDSVPFRQANDVASLEAFARTVLLTTLKGSNVCMLALEGSHHVHL